MTQSSTPAATTRTIKTKHGEITQRVREKGLNRPRDLIFWIWTSIHLAALASVFTLAILGSGLWQISILAVYAGFLSTQISLLVHDTLHGQAPRRHKWLKKPTSFILGNVLVGLSDDWWKPKHDAHHKDPNHLGKDPDIESTFFALDEMQLPSRTKLERFFARHQHWLFFCLIPLQAISFRKASIEFLLSKKHGRVRVIGLLGIALHLAWYGALLFTLGFPAGVAFAVIHQAVFGIYNSLIFAPNHKGMPVIGPDEKLDSFIAQVKTARNVRGGWLFWYISGGLDLQIEHHLFPWMSRFNLSKSQPIVEEFCRETNTPYLRVGIFDSFRQWVGHFRSVAMKA